MVWKLGELQSVHNELRFYVETLHATGQCQQAKCAKRIKHEQKDRTKAFGMFPDHV
jgi:hypothetical protein